jgi:hypothetical protein
VKQVCNIAACVGAASILWSAGQAGAELKENQTLLLYHPGNATSLAIKNAYVQAHPGVHTLALDFTYTAYPPHVTNPVCNSNPCNGHADHPCCACPTIIDPSFNGGEAANEVYITPGLYETEFRQPILEYLEQVGAGNIQAIVTTKGLPAAIAIGFEGGASHVRECVKYSVEGALSRLGFAGGGGSNGYYGKVGMTFDEFLSTDNLCSPGGPTYVGKLFIVSRLDSSDIDDYCNPSTCAVSANAIDDVVDLIGRSLNLEVNKRAVTLVVDTEEEDTYGVAWGHYMSQRDWCVYYDQSCKFLHGTLATTDDPTCGLSTGCGAWEQTVEGAYTDYPEIALSTLGRNHLPWAVNSERVCIGYPTLYTPHPASVFFSIESYNGLSLRIPCVECGGADWNHGQVLDWIAAGGSFTAGYLIGPSGGGPTVDSNYVIINFFEHGLSWGESILTGLFSLHSTTVPIGDPLAVVKVYDPDIDQDGDVDVDDLLLVQNAWGPCPSPPDPCPSDINRDGVVNVDDMNLVIEAWGRDCSNYPTPPPAQIVGFSSMCDFQRCGDVNCDRVIDQTDYDLVEEVVGYPAINCRRGDVNGDGEIDGNDLEIIRANFERCLGDVNGDCQVNVDDLLAVQSAWCTGECDCTNNPQFNPYADFNCDCQVGNWDMTLVLMNWNQSCAGPCAP